MDGVLPTAFFRKALPKGIPDYLAPRVPVLPIHDRTPCSARNLIISMLIELDD